MIVLTYQSVNTTALPGTNISSTLLKFTITKANLLRHDATIRFGINVSALMGLAADITSSVCTISHVLKPDMNLQNACKQLPQEFPDLFKPELGCLNDVQLEVKFKSDFKPVFCKPWVVPLAIQDDLCKAYNVSIARGVWQPTQFNNYGTLLAKQLFLARRWPICEYVGTTQLQ